MFHSERRHAVEGAHLLGMASLGLGLCELACPRSVTNSLGISDNPRHLGILRVLGIRELLHGVSILTESKPNSRLCVSVWSRVAGDVLDSALLAVAATKTKRPASFSAVAAAVAAIGLADAYYAAKVTEHRVN